MKRNIYLILAGGAALAALSFVVTVSILAPLGPASLPEPPAAAAPIPQLPEAPSQSQTPPLVAAAPPPAAPAWFTDSAYNTETLAVPSLRPLRPLTQIALVDWVVRELDWGSIAFDVPQTMGYGRPEQVELVLSPTLSIAELKKQLRNQAGAEAAEVQISNRMEAELTGSGFTIEARTPALQAVASHVTTRWQWDVTPNQTGRQSLHLVLSAYIDVAGRDTPLVVRTFDRDIEVAVTFPQRVSGFVQGNWQWLWTTLIVPIAGFLWRRRKDHRQTA